MNRLGSGFPVLLSYHYAKASSNRLLPVELARRGALVIADSGAYSAHTLGATIGLNEYAGWIAELGDTVTWAASLDVIGDPAGSWANWVELGRQGLTTVPTVHFGTPPAEVDRYAERGQMYLGLGGLLTRVYGMPAIYRWLISVFRYARDNHPDMRFHGWSLTARELLANLPFYTTDSSSFGAGFRYGVAQVFDPAIGKVVAIKMDGSHAGKHGKLLRSYGLTPREVATSSAGNRPLLVRLAMLSCQEMNRYYTARHEVIPPPGYSGTGTRIHFADASMTNIRTMTKLLTSDAVAA